MNIKEHIEAGHYPTDDKGRALVPCEGVAGSRPLITIYATDHGTSYPICGRHPECSDAETYSPDGENLDGNGNLLPPSPRKVKVTRWVALYRDGTIGCVLFDSAAHAKNPPGDEQVGIVELSGEYEEPWS